MEVITSTKNQTVKEIKKLAKKKYRDQTNTYVIEGFHLIEEAIQYNQPLKKLVVTPSVFETIQEVELFASVLESLLVVDELVFQSMSTLPTPQGILAVVDKEKVNQAISLDGPFIMLDQVQDPGNIGTIIRTADAAGFSGVILGEGCADIYQPKVMRAMQGSHFHLPIYQQALEPFVKTLQQADYTVYATALDSQAKSYREMISKEKLAIIMGNEGQGVSDSLLSLVDQTVYIPMPGHAESLNVAVAAGIVMFQVIK